MRSNPRAPKWKLAEEVRDLATRLDRPVCSADLRAYFRQYPERYPMFLQRLGQVLIKVARKTPIRALWPVGKIRSAVYYAPDGSPQWLEKLELYRLMCAVKVRIAEDFPGCVSYLLSGPHRDFARNAFAGFMEEWSPAADSPLLRGWPPMRDFVKLIDAARKQRAEEFIAVSPIDLIDRSAAGWILRQEYRARIDPEVELSLHRHLARLAWPQSSLLPSCGLQRFSRAQVLAYAAAAWANDVDEWNQNQAMVQALRYGIGML